MNVIVYSTTDYKAFRFHQDNRRPGSNRLVRRSIEELDLTPWCPIIVDRAMTIIDGQNRFIACRELGQPVYYVMLPDTVDAKAAMISLNRTQRPWGQLEFLEFHAKAKGGCWKELLDFCAMYRMPLSQAEVIYPDTQNVNSRTIRDGKITFSKHPVADAAARFLTRQDVRRLRYSRTRAFALAVRKAFERYDGKEIEKIRGRLITVPMCANWEQYANAFSNIVGR